MMLGDALSEALGAVGLTEERVSGWLGRPCGCKERREKLNMLNLWAAGVASGKLEKAGHYLLKLMSEE